MLRKARQEVRMQQATKIMPLLTAEQRDSGLQHNDVGLKSFIVHGGNLHKRLGQMPAMPSKRQQRMHKKAIQ